MTPYTWLTPDQITEICDWLQAHGIRPNEVPREPLVEFDETAGEWRIEKYATRPDGEFIWTADSWPVRIIVRRAPRFGMVRFPWPGFDPDGAITQAAGRAAFLRLSDGRHLPAVVRSLLKRLKGPALRAAVAQAGAEARTRRR